MAKVVWPSLFSYCISLRATSELLKTIDALPASSPDHTARCIMHRRSMDIEYWEEKAEMIKKRVDMKWRVRNEVLRVRDEEWKTRRMIEKSFSKWLFEVWITVREYKILFLLRAWRKFNGALEQQWALWVSSLVVKFLLMAVSDGSREIPAPASSGKLWKRNILTPSRLIKKKV